MEDEEAYNSFNYWHVPPASPRDLGLCDDDEPAEAPVGHPDVDEQAMAALTSSSHRQYDAHEDGGSDEDEGEEGYGPDEPMDEPLRLLTGDAGSRLIGILARLSEHLGTDSRFARAASVLQDDVLRVRHQQQEAPELVEPSETSTLVQPEV